MNGITLLTDFGYQDGYVGAMKGVLAGLAPGAPVYDIAHGLPPQDIRGAAYVLLQYVPYFPPDTVHLAVVDPGVGTDRRILLVRVLEQWVMAPDNGLCSLLLLRHAPDDVRVLRSDLRPREAVSQTFHGRDLFAYCGATLASGVGSDELSEPTADWVRLPHIEPEACLDRAEVKGHVLHIDRFGNVITTITEESLSGVVSNPVVAEICVGDLVIHGIRGTYHEAGAGDSLTGLIGSSGFLEIAVPSARASDLINAAPEMAVSVRSQPD